MTRYSVEPRGKIFVKGYGFSFFAKCMGKNSKNISKNLSSKYSQKLLNHAQQSEVDAIKPSSKRVIQKTAKATGDLIGNKIANKITVSRNLKETVTNEHDKEIPKKKT